MGTIIKKKIKNGTYYYYVESKRIDGKPKLINQKYLGTADALRDKCAAMANLQGTALYSNISSFGDVTLLYDIAQRLSIPGIINNHVPKRKQGATVGEYILTAAINRAVDPTSTNGLKEWYADTCLPLITGHAPTVFTPQNFWNNTAITADELRIIEDDIVGKIVRMYDLNTSKLIYDTTNFFTFIDTNNDSELAKRGHSKEKRNDLKVVGMSLMVTPDHNIPLFHDIYPGNRSDSEEFAKTLRALNERYMKVVGHMPDTTLIFDRGNNSQDNIDFIEEMDMNLHYVGGLTSAQCSELYEIPLEAYTSLASESLKWDNNSAYRTRKNIFGRELTVVIVHNPKLLEGQLQGIRENAKKAESKLKQMKQRLEGRKDGTVTKGKKPTVDGIIKNIKTILSAEYMPDLFTASVTEEDGHVMLSYIWNEALLGELIEKKLGKTALFTDRDDFTNEEVVAAYRSAWHVETAFRQMKDASHLTVRPIFHWTDDKIRVHIFCCILAYRLCCLLQKELAQQGLVVSIDTMLNQAAKVKQITTFFGSLDKPNTVRTFSRSSEDIDKIMEAYALKEKYAR